MGPLFVVSCLNILNFPMPVLSPHINQVAQIILGYFLGSAITPEYLKQMKQFFLPIVMTVVYSLLVTFGIGYVIHFVLPLDIATGILSAAPGGLPEVGVIALALQAEIPTITLIHIVRIFVVIAFIPLVIKVGGLGSSAVTAKNNPKTKVKEHERISLKELAATGVQKYRNKFHKVTSWLLHWTPVIAVAGGFIFNALQIPAGFMLGGMLAVVAASVKGLKVKPLPPELFGTALLIIGIVIGMQFTRETLVQLSDIYMHVVLINIIILISGIGLAYIMHRVTGWKFLVCILASAPAAIFMMAAIASDTDSEPFKVSLLHIARLFTVKLTLPIIALFLM